MRQRLKGMKRIVEVQRHLYNLEEVKYARLTSELARLQTAQEELRHAFANDEALQGLFVDLMVRRLKALQQDEVNLKPLIEAQARVMLDHGGRLRNSERVAEDLGVELRRVEERDELERLMEAAFAQEFASSEQDP
jgi:hypothetical protein